MRWLIMELWNEEHPEKQLAPSCDIQIRKEIWQQSTCSNHFLLKTFDMKHLEITKASRLRTPIEKLFKNKSAIICLHFLSWCFCKTCIFRRSCIWTTHIGANCWCWPSTGFMAFKETKFRRIEKKPRFKNRGSKTAKLQKWRTESLVSWLEPEWVCWRLLARSQVKSDKTPPIGPRVCVFLLKDLKATCMECCDVL